MPADLSRDIIDLLTEDLGQLDALAPGLGQRALAWVTASGDAPVTPSGDAPNAAAPDHDRDGESLLALLEQSSGAGRALQLRCCSYGRRPDPETARARLMRAEWPQPPKLCLRLAHIYDTAAAADPTSARYRPAADRLGAAAWLEVFLQEATQLRLETRQPHPTSVRAETVERMLELAGEPPDRLVALAWLHAPLDPGALEQPAVRMPRLLDGFGRYAERHADPIRRALSDPDVKRRRFALRLIAATGDLKLERLAPALVELAVGSDRAARGEAEALLERACPAAVPLLVEQAVCGSPSERTHAIRALARIDAEGSRPFLQSRLQRERAARVKKAIAAALAEPATPASSAPGTPGTTAPAAPAPLAPVALRAPLAPAVRTAFCDFIAALNDFEQEETERRRTRGQVYRPRMHDDETVAAALAWLEDMRWDDVKGHRQAPLYLEWHHYQPLDPALKGMVEQPELTPIQLVRFLRLLGALYLYRDRLTLDELAPPLLAAYRRSRSERLEMRQLAAALDTLGVEPAALARAALAWHRSEAFRWEPEATWPFFAGQLPILEEVLGARPPSRAHDEFERRPQRLHALLLLQGFPTLPPSLVDGVWGLAKGNDADARRAARRALEKLPDLADRLLAELRARRLNDRITAAGWIADRGDPAAAETLRAAFAREKRPQVRAALLDALERLGIEASALVDRTALVEEARKAMAGGPRPAALPYLERLPPLRFATDGGDVPAELPAWLLTQALKGRDPVPGAQLRAAAALFEETGRQALAAAILTIWIARDASAASGSAIGERGVLALAGACGGDLAAPVAAWIDQHHETRSRQAKALLEMLHRVDHPAAAQTLLDIGGRFRTPAIQRTAAGLAAAVAARRGWTVDQLADRTVPTAGLDRNGELTLAVGRRRLSARLSDDDLKLALLDEAGRPLRSLPPAETREDRPALKAARHRLASARRELKAALATEKARLYEALCTQREWRFEDWQRDLLEHPIVGRLCRTLVWSVGGGEPDAAPRTFLPAPDGHLREVDGTTLKIEPGATVRLAHRAHMRSELADEWRRHTAGRGLRPPFAQLTRGMYRPPAAARNAATVDDFDGHVIAAHKLAKAAARLGYRSSDPDERGVYYFYLKPFPARAIEAAIELSGHTRDGDDTPVALHSLLFTGARPTPADDEPDSDGPERVQLRLCEVPPVLLSECYHDLADIAACGEGHDPQS